MVPLPNVYLNCATLIVPLLAKTSFAEGDKPVMVIPGSGEPGVTFKMHPTRNVPLRSQLPGCLHLVMRCSEKHFREDRNGLIKPNCKGRLRWRRTVRLLVGSADSTESREGCLRVLKLPFRIKTGQRCRRILSPDKRLVPGRRLSRSCCLRPEVNDCVSRKSRNV